MIPLLPVPVRHAVSAAAVLAAGVRMSADAITDALGFRRRSIETTLQSLTRAGFLEARRGRHHAGYVLARLPENIRLDEIAAAFGFRAPQADSAATRAELRLWRELHETTLADLVWSAEAT